jgi:hypothetical protein
LNLESAISEGVHFLQKPYSVEKLLQSVRQSLDSPNPKAELEKGYPI